MEYLSAIGGLVILLVIGVGGLIMLYLIWDDARPVDFSRWPDLTATIRTRIGALSSQTAIMVIAVLVAAATVYLVASYGGLQSERAESAPLAAVATETPPAPPPPAAVNMVRTVSSTSCASDGCPVSCGPDEALVSAFCITGKSARLAASLQPGNGVVTAKCHATSNSIVASCARQ